MSYECNSAKQIVFLKFNEALHDIPIHACYMCERLCFSKQCTILISNLQHQIYSILKCEFITNLE